MTVACRNLASCTLADLYKTARQPAQQVYHASSELLLRAILAYVRC